MILVKLKTKKQLEAIGYTHNPKSLFAPMSIDVDAQDRRLKDNGHKVITMDIFRMLGKSVYVDVLNAYEKQGVMLAKFSVSDDKNSRSSRWLPICISADLDGTKIKAAIAKDLVQKEALEKKQREQEEFKNKKITAPFRIGGYDIHYFVNQNKVSVGCRTLTMKEITKFNTFINKVSKKGKK